MTIHFSPTVSFMLKEDTTPILNRSYVDTKDITKYNEQSIIVPAGTTDYAVSFGNVTIASLVYIETDKQLTFKLNGTGNPAITCKDVVYLSSAGILSLYLTNATTSNATVKIFLA